MDYNLDRSLRFSASSEGKTLYTWSIGEFDEAGKQLGIDQIPWVWSLSFAATEMVLADSVSIKRNFKGEDVPAELEVGERHVIRAKLRPGDPYRDHEFHRQTKFRMFGTNRVIEQFTLDITPVAPGEPERCWAWGSPEYEAEIDFYKRAEPDIVCFYMQVNPDKFDRYARRIADGTADELVLRVQGVRGFYSEWSPSIFTREVKVLTPGTEHAVVAPDGKTYDVPRLGDIREGEIYINAKRLQSKTLPGADDVVDEDETAPLIRPDVESRYALPDPQLALALKTLQASARWIIGLLVVIVLVLAFGGH
ncbi:hypothetical protein [Devosia sp. LjRoot3]|uniref:hypothetical protein n=1 Tax=Devosia sp. LjRoot3 TaxID=3342319 RepID=UPI003ECE6FB3